MADYDSSLPIRTENDGDVVSKIADATIPSQQLKVNADGSIDTNTTFPPGTEIQITDGTDTLLVNADGSINTVTTATNLDIRDLVFATDKVDVTGSVIDLSATTLTALESITVQNGAGAAAVNIQDGGNSITVDGTLTVTATDLDIRDLTHVSDSIKVGDGTDFLAVNADGSINITDNGGSLTVDAVNLDTRDLVFATDKVDVSGSTVTSTNFPTTVDTDYGTVGANTIRTASQIGNATGAANFGAGTTTAQTLRVSANLLDSTGTAFSLTNPLAVVLSDATPGTSVNDYDTTAAVAGGGSDTHTYTVPGGSTFYFNQIEASASGKMKIEVQVNAVTKFVQFNSTAQTNMSIHIENPITATAGQTVTVIRTNRDNQAQNVYSTISGYLLP